MTEQPAPIATDHPPAWGLVITDIRDHFQGFSPASGLVIADAQARDDIGRQRYGVPLTAFNGRDSLWDAYEEILDCCVYLKAALLETEASEPATDDEEASELILCYGLVSQYGQALRMCVGLRDLILRRDGK